MTRPLSDYAIAVLHQLRDAPIPRHSLNPGLTLKLMRERLAYLSPRPSPYKKHRGAMIDHLVLAPAGLELLDGL